MEDAAGIKALGTSHPSVPQGRFLPLAGHAWRIVNKYGCYTEQLRSSGARMAHQPPRSGRSGGDHNSQIISRLGTSAHLKALSNFDVMGFFTFSAKPSWVKSFAKLGWDQPAQKLMSQHPSNLGFLWPTSDRTAEKPW